MAAPAGWGCPVGGGGVDRWWCGPLLQPSLPLSPASSPQRGSPAPPSLPPLPSPALQTPLFSFKNYVNGESLEGQDVVVWAMIGAQVGGHAPLVPLAGRSTAHRPAHAALPHTANIRLPRPADTALPSPPPHPQHVPRSEDAPLITNMGTHMMIKPWNYFDELASMEGGWGGRQRGGEGSRGMGH